MNTLSSIKQFAASSAIAGALGFATIGGPALVIAASANAAPGASSATSSSTSTGSDQHDGKTQRDQHEQSKKHPNKFNPSPTAGSSAASASTLGSNQETDGPTVPRSWYPEMPHQGG
jgi:hypothetical protein